VGAPYHATITSRLRSGLVPTNYFLPKKSLVPKRVGDR
jgi:hypothetical protein